MVALPPAVATVTFTVPVPLGAVTDTCVVLLKVTAAAAAPNVTVVPVAVKLLPVRTTALPPASGPAAGATVVNVGGSA